MIAKQEEVVFDATNESVVLGAAIVDDERRKSLVRAISPDEFLIPEHATVWRALRVMVDRNLSFEAETFRRLVLDESPDYDPATLQQLVADASSSANLDWHVETLRWDAARARVLRGPVNELLKCLKDQKAVPDSVASAARSVLRSVEGGYARKYIRRPEELSRSYKADLAARRATGNFYSSGFDAMDARLVEGSAPGKVEVWVGLSGSGKSTFVANKAIAQAKQGRRVMVGAWEMGSMSMLDVMLSSACRIELERVVQGNLDDDEFQRVSYMTDWLTTRIKFMDNAFFDASIRGPGVKPDNNRALDVLEGYISESGCDVIVMDLWERCLPDLSYSGVTQALYRQQLMAQEYNFNAVIVHQLLLKDVEKRVDKRPTREGIKGTGAYTEVADQIFGVHREAQFKAVPDDSLEVICLKQRKGKANWAVRFDWDGSRSLISNGVEVAYDPGLESAAQFGDLAEVSEIKTRRRSKA